MKVKLTKHFIKRFRKRVAHTDRVADFAERAYHDGWTTDDIKDKSLLFMLSGSEVAHGSSVRIYQNFAYWFHQGYAITVYRLPHQYWRKVQSRS